MKDVTEGTTEKLGSMELSPPNRWLILIFTVLIAGVLYWLTWCRGMSITTNDVNFRALLEVSTVAIGILTALLYVVGYVYEWDFRLCLGLPADLFAVQHEDYLVRGAIAIVSCRKGWRFVYILPLVLFVGYLWQQLHFEKSLGSIALIVNVGWFFMGVWVLLHGLFYFAASDVQELATHSHEQCFRIHTLHFKTTGEKDASDKKSPEEDGVECYLMRCTPNAVAFMERKRKRVRIVKREDVDAIDVGNVSVPNDPVNYFLLISTKNLEKPGGVTFRKALLIALALAAGVGAVWYSTQTRTAPEDMIPISTNTVQTSAKIFSSLPSAPISATILPA